MEVEGVIECLTRAVKRSGARRYLLGYLLGRAARVNGPPRGGSSKRGYILPPNSTVLRAIFHYCHLFPLVLRIHLSKIPLDISRDEY